MLLLCLLIRDVFTFNKSEANFHNSMKMRQNSNTVMMIGTTLMDDRMKTDTDKESLTLNRLKTVEEEKLDEELNKSVSSQKSNRSSRSNRDKRRQQKGQKRNLGYAINDDSEDFNYQMKDHEDEFDQFNSSFSKKNYLPGAPMPFIQNQKLNL